jgi:hypothetical protein
VAPGKRVYRVAALRADRQKATGAPGGLSSPSGCSPCAGVLLRPRLEVRSGALGELERERFDPHIVVCSRPNGEHPGGRGAWVRIPTDDETREDERLAEVCLDGEHWTTEGPPLAELLGAIDRTEERLREGGLTEACRKGGRVGRLYRQPRGHRSRLLDRAHVRGVPGNLSRVHPHHCPVASGVTGLSSPGEMDTS